MNTIIVQIATSEHQLFAEEICQLIETSAAQRGTGIAKREPEYIRQKMAENKAIIALTPKKELVGFCYIETWSDKKYVANSGLIVKPEFRSSGAATKIKKKAFEHSRKMYPQAKLFGLTTSLPVMKINSELGYMPVTYDHLTTDETFWKGCQSCVNYQVLMSKNKSNCLCTAMLYDPVTVNGKRWNFLKKSKLYERFMRLKKNRLLKKSEKK
jgi:N-acetylglutamate synthase-like GNAT family acetyltransferase